MSVQAGTPYSDRIRQGREGLPANLAAGKQTAFEILASWESIFGREINSASDYREFLVETMESVPENEYKFLGWWVVPYVTDELAEENRVTRILNKVKNRQGLSHAESGSACFFALRAALTALRRRDLRTIQLIVGAEVLRPHRSITQWHGNFCGSIARIAGEFEDFHFNLSSASDLFTHDLAALAKHVPNISVAGYWWHTLYPFYIRKSLETRLDMVPMNKIIAYFSDAYHAEWCYPKLKMVKQIVEEILLERIERGWYRVETAVEIIEKIFHENPKRIYGV